MIEEFFTKLANGIERTLSEYNFSEEKLKKHKRKKSRFKEDDLPSRVDLRSEMTEIENQGKTNSCVANAVAGAYEHLAKIHEEIEYDVSRLFIYYNARYIGNLEGADKGCYISDAIQGLQEYGACSEETYPFEKELVNEEPPEEAYEEAEGFLIESVEVIPTDLHTWRSTLAEGYPIIFATKLFKSFDYHRKKGLIPYPSKKETSRSSHSAHAMLCVGYSDKDKVFIVRNSWGEAWGDKGYCYIPYRYLMNENFNLGDSWIIQQLDSFEHNEDYWYDDEESILSDIESELADMSDEDYEDFIDEMGDYPLELRLGHLMLYAAEEDDDLSDDEYDEIAGYLKGTLERLGLDSLDPLDVLEECEDMLEEEGIIDETIQIFGDYLSKEALMQLVNDIESLIEVDNLSEDEDNFLYMLVEAWEIDYDENGEEDDEDYDDEDYDDDNADYDDEYDDNEEYDDDEYDDYDEDYDDEEEDDRRHKRHKR